MWVPFYLKIKYLVPTEVLAIKKTAEIPRSVYWHFNYLQNYNSDLFFAGSENLKIFINIKKRNEIIKYNIYY